jgi:4-amino-4-deoxy-L-arabinose transferase-like glycosyltransferase
MEKLKASLRKLTQHPYFVPGCLLTGVVLRLLWIWLVRADQVSDFVWYQERAVSIANGAGYAVDGRPTAYWPVGYPGFLGVLFSIFGPSVLLAKLVNLVLYMGIIALTYSFTKEIFHSEYSGRIGLAILCFYPNHIAYTSLLATEIFVVFLVMLGGLLLMRAAGRIGLLIPAGLCWGVATLTKPQLIFLPLLFLAIFSKNIKALLQSAIIVFLVIAACLAPWVIRNDRVMGKPLLSTNGGIVLMQANNPYATGKHIWDENVDSLLGDLRSKGEEMFDGKEVAREARARQVGINYIEQHPLRVLSLWPKKLFYLYRSDVDGFYYTMGMIPDLSRTMHLLYVALRVWAELYYFFVMGLALFCWRVVRNGSRPYRLGVYVILYFTAICLVFFGNARYHFPVIPWVAMYAGVSGALLLGLWPESESGHNTGHENAR